MNILNLIIFCLTIQQTLTTLTDEELKTKILEVIRQECMPKSSETVLNNMKIDIEGMKPAVQSNQNKINEGMQIKRFDLARRFGYKVLLEMETILLIPTVN